MSVYKQENYIYIFSDLMITIQKEMKNEYLESVDPYSKCLALHVVVDESEMCVDWV